ncbi:hypothetical protein GIB67_004182 [Kingdonia uniflora]|uniref:Ribosome maturation factor RimM n=1 Tax=Kingdonia uniflora TaxID=39325 RepID=A0A7J7LM05_9MAGN|nr:hypothetical protein GIB67_004182 [Kingdonia uniflora]
MKENDDPTMALLVFSANILTNIVLCTGESRLKRAIDEQLKTGKVWWIICNFMFHIVGTMQFNVQETKQRCALQLPQELTTVEFLTIVNKKVDKRIERMKINDELVEESAETSSNDESEFVEIGYVFNVFGIDGELRVKPNTDFPELRFSTPGRRWLKERFSGKESIREVELVEGRDHPGQKSWIVSFNGVDTVEEAKQLIGSTLLVREEDRPLLEEGEFYTRDLVGMRVILKETAQPVGSVINVYNSGASDLLEVMLDSAQKTHDDTDSSKSGATISSHIVLVPFVEAIVPDVNMNRREMYITPPKGLLELNLRSEEKSKKERRKLEWQQRKKATRRLIAAKKKFSEMEQKHIFHGLRFGDKAQKTLLADNIAGVNLKLFEHAIQKVEVLPKR